MARILLVDDDRDIRDLGRSLIARTGNEVFVAEHAIEAIEILHSQSIDLLITDANMPQHSGYDLIKTLRRYPKYKGIIIAMLTARRERKDIERALELGIHDYIIKPIDPLIFLKKVEDLLERRPAAERERPEFATFMMNIPAKAVLPIELVAVSEVGLTVRSPHSFKEGSRFELDSDLFTKMGATAPVMKVQSCAETQGGQFESRIDFVGADEKLLSKVRSWVHTSMAKKRAG